MTKQKKYIFAIALLGLAALAAWTQKDTVGCAVQEAQISTTIASKNYCTTDADCAGVTACPFGCHVPVNKKELAGIEQSIAVYNQQCMECDYSCYTGSPIICRENKCVVKHDR